MKKSDFYYFLPESLIAQTPVEPRDSSRLMYINKNTGEINHKKFYDLSDFLNQGDCLVLNDTRVFTCTSLRQKKGKRRSDRVFTFTSL